MDVAYPFLLELYQDYSDGALAEQDFVEAVRLVEAYVFRRAICAIPTNSLNKTFATFGKALKKDRYLESIKAHLLGLPSYRRFPSDEEFRRDLQTRDLYNFRSRSYWLRRLENHGRKERVPVDEYTIEHIMPQNENLSAAWQAGAGSRVGDCPEDVAAHARQPDADGLQLGVQRPAVHREARHGGRLQGQPAQAERRTRPARAWDENAIKERASKLAATAVDVWKSPKLPADVLEAYQAKATTAGYSIDDHPYLLTSTMSAVFEAFRREVLALDPCVTEEFLKLYVAYKAETNFVDVVPQAKRLRLSLNLSFQEVDDPRCVCETSRLGSVGQWRR